MAATLGLSGCASGVSGLDPLPATASADQYRLDTGDEVRVTAFGLDTMTNTYRVSDAGTISLPLLNDVPATGKTVGQLQKEITDLLLQRQILRTPSVNVQITQYRPFYILGEVKKPGEYPYRPGMSVLTAISVAGGYTFRANTKKLSITRHGGDGNVTGIVDETAMIQPGDTIRVYEAWF